MSDAKTARGAKDRPDFRGVETWLFDLDNTLHDASHAIFPAINRLMTAYVARVLGSDDPDRPVAARRALQRVRRGICVRLRGRTARLLVRQPAIAAVAPDRGGPALPVSGLPETAPGRDNSQSILKILLSACCE